MFRRVPCGGATQSTDTWRFWSYFRGVPSRLRPRTWFAGSLVLAASGAVGLGFMLWGVAGLLVFSAAVAMAVAALRSVVTTLRRMLFVQVENPHQLRAVVTAFRDNLEYGPALYLRSSTTNLLLRIYRRVPKTKPSYYTLEVRNSERNRAHYSGVRDALVARAEPIRETLTPKRRQPKSLQLRFDDDGPLCLSALVAALATALERSAPPDPFPVTVTNTAAPEPS